MDKCSFRWLMVTPKSPNNDFLCNQGFLKKGWITLGWISLNFPLIALSVCRTPFQSICHLRLSKYSWDDVCAVWPVWPFGTTDAVHAKQICWILSSLITFLCIFVGNNPPAIYTTMTMRKQKTTKRTTTIQATSKNSWLGNTKANHKESPSWYSKNKIYSQILKIIILIHSQDIIYLNILPGIKTFFTIQKIQENPYK